MSPTIAPPQGGCVDPALPLKQAGKHIGKCSRTVARYIDRGLLTAVVLGPGIRAVRQSELDRFLAGDPDRPLPPKPVLNVRRDARGRIIAHENRKTGKARPTA